MELTKIQAKRLSHYQGYLKNALVDATSIEEPNKEQLFGLASRELEIPVVLDAEPVAPTTLAMDMATIAKGVRMAGELPYYLAKVLAVYFAEQGVTSEELRVTVQQDCGLIEQKELIQAVVDAFELLPNLELSDQDQHRVEQIKEAYRKGDHYERVYRGCAQCCMAAISQITGKEDPVLFRAANGFAAGMGLLGDGVCGGYSGGILSMGMFAGRRKEFFDGDKEEKDLCTLLVGKLHQKFIDTYGSVTCHHIHNQIFGRAFHITHPQEKEAFEQAGAHSKDKCPAVVGTAAAWTVEILQQHGLLDIDHCREETT